MIKTLDKFKVGEIGIIAHVAGEGLIRRRLLDMGVTPGAKVILQKKAPLGDPIQINIRGYDLTLRRKEASYISLEVCK